MSTFQIFTNAPLSGSIIDEMISANAGIQTSKLADGSKFLQSNTAVLNDLQNVDESTTADGYVLTWDNGSHQWTAQQSGGGATVLSDLNDVDTSATSTNDVLTWNGSQWVSSAPQSTVAVLSDLNNVDASASGTDRFLGWDGSYWSSMLISGTTHDHDTSALTSGTLGITRGGTNQTSYTNSHLVYYNGSSLASSNYKSDSYTLTGQHGTHTGDATIHYTQASMNLGNIGNVNQSATADGYVLTWNNGSSTWQAQQASGGGTQVRTVFLENPTIGEFIPVFWTPEAITISHIQATLSAGSITAYVKYNFSYGTSLGSGTNVTTTPVAISSNTTGYSAVINNGSVPASSWVWFYVTDTSTYYIRWMSANIVYS